MAEIVRTEELRHRFADGREGLAGISMSLSEGEFVVLAGRNGAGKSLLAKHLIGLKRPSSGRVLFRGKPLSQDLQGARACMGLVFQDAEAQVIGQTVAEDVAFGPENLRLGADEVRARVERSLSRVGMAGMGDRRPDSLSGGEKRRLAIAGVLAMDARCVILDEPFANLDLESIRMVVGTLRDLHAAGSAILLMTHELEKALGLATRLVVLESGAIRYDGDPDSFPRGDFGRFGLADPFRAYSGRSELAWL